MSAWIIDQVHVDLIMGTALRVHDRMGSWAMSDDVEDDALEFSSGGENYRRLDFTNADQVGDMLVRECVRSVSYRYDDNGDLPGPIEAYYLEPYTFTRRSRSLSPVECLKAISCYEYQSCEHPEWAKSEAHAFCDTLRHAMIGELDGYAEAPWGFSLQNA